MTLTPNIMASSKSPLPRNDLFHGIPPTLADLVASSKPVPPIPKDPSAIPTVISFGPRWDRWPGPPQIAQEIEAWIRKTKMLIYLYNSDYLDPESYPAVNKKQQWRGWDVYDAAGSREDRVRLQHLRLLRKQLEISKKVCTSRQAQLLKQRNELLSAKWKEPRIKSTKTLLQREDSLVDELYPDFATSPEVSLYSRWIKHTQSPFFELNTPFVRESQVYKTSLASPREAHKALPFHGEPASSIPTTSSDSSNAKIVIPKEAPSDFKPPNSYPHVFPAPANGQPASSQSEEKIALSLNYTPIHRQQQLHMPSTPRLMVADRGTKLLGSHPITPSPLVLSPFQHQAPAHTTPVQQQHLTVSPRGTHYYNPTMPTPNHHQAYTPNAGNDTSMYFADQSSNADTPLSVQMPAYWNPHSTSMAG